MKTTTANAPLIGLHGVTRSYALGKTRVHALRGVDLAIHPHELVVVVGPSGSGKSTLLNIIGCLDVPTGGEYRLDGQLVTARDVDELADVRNARIGFVFQSFNLIPVLDVAENIEFPLTLRGHREAGHARQMARDLAERVGLGDFLHHRPDELSGGQRQRVAIARALVTRPDIVLADEPTANLDSATADQILDLMEELNRTNGTTFLISTHDQRVLKRANRVIELVDGQVVGEVGEGVEGVEGVGKAA